MRKKQEKLLEMKNWANLIQANLNR